MKHKYLVLLILIIGYTSCKKSDSLYPKNVSINIINAVINSSAFKFNFSEREVNYLNVSEQVPFGTNRFYYSVSGIVKMEVISVSDQNKIILSKALTLDKDSYSLFLTGTSPNIDTVLISDKLPFIRTDVSKPLSSDSVVNIRFVNLSPNSPALKVKIRNNSENEVENLKYKDVGDWKSYPNKANAATNYVFEIRDASTDTILSTYTFGATSTNRFKNVSLILKGLFGTTTGTNAFGVQLVNYF